MPQAVQQRSLQEIRRSLGYLLGAVTVSTPTTSGGTSSHTDASILGSTSVDAFRGYWLQPLGGASSGQIRRISANSSASIFSYLTAITSALTTATTYELWEEDMPPARLDDFITRAILDLGRKAFIDSTDLSLHATAKAHAYALSSSIAGVYRVEYRKSYTGKSVQTCDAAWDDQLLANVTRAADGEQVREGSGSNRLTVAAAASSGILSADSFAALNLSGMSHIEAWLRCEAATSASDFDLLLGSSTNLSTPVQTLDVPALSSAAWTYARMALTTPAATSAVAAIGLTAVNDIGAYRIWIDGVVASDQGSEEWAVVPQNLWRLDQDRRELVFSETGLGLAGYSLLKLSTVVKPTLPTVNGSLIQVDPEFVTNKAAAMALRARADRRSDRREADLQQADVYDAIAESRRRLLHVPDGVRWVAD